jgi:O-antigen ligase
MAVLAVPLVLLFVLRGETAVRFALLGIAALLAAGWCFAHPFPALCAAVFVAYSSLDLFLPGPVTLSLLAVAMARVFYDSLAPRPEAMPFDWGSTNFRISLVVLLAIALTSVLVAYDIHLALFQMWEIGLGLALYVAVSHLADSPRRIVTLALSMSAAILASVIVDLRGVPLSGGLALLGVLTVARVSGVRADANIIAVLANSLIPLVLFAASGARGWRRAASFALFVLLIGIVIMAGSRSGVGVLLMLFLVLFWRERRLRILAALVLAALVLVLPRLPPAYWVRFVSLFQLHGIVVDRSLQLRQHVLQVGWQLFLHHPWLGVGLGNFEVNSPRGIMLDLEAHNSYLEIAASLGVFGFIAYMAWLASGFGMLRRAAALWRVEGHRRDRGLAESLALALAAYCVSAFFLSIPFHLMLWFVLGLANAARRSAQAGAG